MRKLLGTLAVLISLGVVTGSEASELAGCFGFTGGADDGNITFLMFRSMPPGSFSKPCRDQECRARKELACAANALSHRLHPNTMAYPTRAEANRYWVGYGRVLWSLGRTHPGRIPLYCRLLREVARTVTGKEDEHDWTAHNVVELAIGLERPGNGCLGGVLGALPDVEPVRTGAGAWGAACLRAVRQCQGEMRRDYLGRE